MNLVNGTKGTVVMLAKTTKQNKTETETKTVHTINTQIVNKLNF